MAGRKTPALSIRVDWDERTKNWTITGHWQRSEAGPSRVWFLRAETGLAMEQDVAEQLVRVVRAELEGMLPF